MAQAPAYPKWKKAEAPLKVRLPISRIVRLPVAAFVIPTESLKLSRNYHQEDNHSQQQFLQPYGGSSKLQVSLSLSQSVSLGPPGI